MSKNIPLYGLTLSENLFTHLWPPTSLNRHFYGPSYSSSRYRNSSSYFDGKCFPFSEFEKKKSFFLQINLYLRLLKNHTFSVFFFKKILAVKIFVCPPVKKNPFPWKLLETAHEKSTVPVKFSAKSHPWKRKMWPWKK